MPLIQSKSKKAISQNIKKEVNAGKPVKQAIAIAENVKNKRGSSTGYMVTKKMPDKIVMKKIKTDEKAEKKSRDEVEEKKEGLDGHRSRMEVRNRMKTKTRHAI